MFIFSSAIYTSFCLKRCENKRPAEIKTTITKNATFISNFPVIIPFSLSKFLFRTMRKSLNTIYNNDSTHSPYCQSFPRLSKARIWIDCFYLTPYFSLISANSFSSSASFFSFPASPSFFNSSMGSSASSIARFTRNASLLFSGKSNTSSRSA